jgi:hypothetical protein
MNNTVKNVILAPMNILYKFSPTITLKILYRLKTGQKLNLESPRTFKEKLQWIKLYYKNDLLPICVDKYEVRQFIKACGCENILNKLLWDGFNAKDIPFKDLPQKFVIKVTHGQGFNIVCKDKNQLNIPKTIKKLNRWLKVKYLPCYGEWFYGIVKPRIIIEEFLNDGKNETPNDYKIYCFNGNPKMINAHVDRFTNHKSNLYDINWNVINNVSFKYLDSNLFIEKPKELDEMLEYAKKLSSKFIHVRVDFYIVNSKIYFGELTFTDGAGFDEIGPREFDEMLGDWMIL